MNNPPQSNICPQCHAVLPADAPQGLCPACLMAAVALPTEAGTASPPKTPPPTRDLVAAAFPQLEILELIGAGGMGYVFKARQPKLDRLVALKLLPQSLAADPAFAGRFEREGRILARLSHSNIVTVHDFGFAPVPRAGDLQSPSAPPLSTLNPQLSTSQTGFYYLLMEFVDGVNLRQAMRAGRFTPVQALEVVPKICEALQFAHEQGILHRDIKPENILLDAKGRVKLVDFGIAKLLHREGDAPVPDDAAGTTPFAAELGDKSVPSTTLTSATAALGTPSYMAPEQRDRPADVDHRADIYSLGVVFYEMLTGELPVGKFAPPSAKSTSDPRMDEVVLRALEQQREHRQQSAGEVKTQVETIASSPGSSRREEAHSLKPSWFKPVGLLCVLAGLVGWLPTVASLGSHRVVGSYTVFLSATGLAFLTCHPWWRWLAIGCNALMIVSLVFNELWVLVLAAIGKIPPGAPWPSDFGGVATQLAGGVPNSLLLLSSFGAGVWALFRADARAAFAHQPASQQEHRVIGALAVLALAGGLLTSTVARHLAFDPVVFGLKAAGVIGLAAWCLLRDRKAGPLLRPSHGWSILLGALATLALVIGLTMLIGGTALSEWLKQSPFLTSRKSPPATTPPAAQNTPVETPAVSHSLDSTPKQFMLSRFTNMNGFAVMSAETPLAPGESALAWLVHADGRRELALTSEHMIYSSGTEMPHLSWFWRLRAPFTTNRADEVVAQLRERWEGRLLSCLPGQPVKLFTITNEQGATLSGELLFQRALPDVTKPAIAEVRFKSVPDAPHVMAFIRPTVPAGYALHLRSTGTETASANASYSLAVTGGSEDGTCSWSWPGSRDFAGETAKAAIAQVQSFLAQGPVLVTNGQPRTVFSVTNANGKIYSGQFELRGPASTK